jgi:hypothetical protein
VHHGCRRLPRRIATSRPHDPHARRPRHTVNEVRGTYVRFTDAIVPPSALSYRFVRTARAVRSRLPIHVAVAGERDAPSEARLTSAGVTLLEGPMVPTPAWASKWHRLSFNKIAALSFTQFRKVGHGASRRPHRMRSDSRDGLTPSHVPARCREVWFACTPPSHRYRSRIGTHTCGRAHIRIPSHPHSIPSHDPIPCDLIP